MLQITIESHTTPTMLRAIRAACNELLSEPHADLTTRAAEHVTRANELQAAAGAEAYKAAAALSAHNSQTVELRLPTAAVEALQDFADKELAASELDSAGHPWNPELHSPSRAKIADGTWKKRRGAAVPSVQINPGPHFPADSAPTPPVPPAPTAPLVTMNDIYALVTGGKRTINDVIALAQEVGFADVGAFSREATPEQRAEMLRKLEG